MKTHRTNISKTRIQGFSLIEVMIVVTIVAILVSIAWPLFHAQRLKSQRAEAVAIASMLRLEMERCASNNNGVYVNACIATATNAVLPAVRAKYDPSASRGDIYNIAIILTALPNGGTGYTITINNIPANDDDCTAFTIDNFGNKGFTEVAGSQSSVTRCWGSN